MRVSIFVCDTPEALIQSEAGLGTQDEVLYMTPDATKETGDIVRYLVKPPKSPGAMLDSFAGKYILIARRP